MRVGARILERMKEGEVITIMDKDGNWLKKVLIDSQGKRQEFNFNETPTKKDRLPVEQKHDPQKARVPHPKPVYC